MTIETKYNIGDEVWVMYNNYPYNYKIAKILIIYEDRKLLIQYKTRGGKYFLEQDLFPTKEELLKSL